jgi:MFS family permease
MANQSSETIPRPSDLSNRTNPAVLYALSYLVTRAIIGILGVLLPVAFIIGEAYLSGSVKVRGSLSAYYHSSMRDVFVAGLCVIGFFLITYLSGETKTRDFRLSLLAGVAVLFVVFFPTKRPDLAPDAPLCGVTPMPQGCSPLQQQLGEQLVAGIHFAAAAVFILSLAWLCFVFADPKREKSPRMRAIVRACGWVILAAVAWTVVGGFLKANIWKLTPLYVGEVVSVLAFGTAWLVKARDLRKALGAPPGARRTADDRQGRQQPSESSG